MAKTKTRGSEIYVDDTDMRVLFDALKTVDVELRKSTNAQLRIAAKECADDLARRLKAAAYAEPAPQTRLVAESIKTKTDRTPVVMVGGTKKVGRPYRSRKTKQKRAATAGDLLWSVEYGDTKGRFAPRNPNGYWITLTSKVFAESPTATDNYKRAVLRILQEANVI